MFSADHLVNRPQSFLLHIVADWFMLSGTGDYSITSAIHKNADRYCLVILFLDTVSCLNGNTIILIMKSGKVKSAQIQK